MMKGHYSPPNTPRRLPPAKNRRNAETLVFVVVIAFGIIRSAISGSPGILFLNEIRTLVRTPSARSGDNYEHRNGAERTTEPNLYVYYH
jgi:hypothetical protein